MSRIPAKSRFWTAPPGPLTVRTIPGGTHVRMGELQTALGSPPRSVLNFWRRRDFPPAVKLTWGWCIPVAALGWIETHVGTQIHVAVE